MTTKELAAKLDHVVASMMRDKEAVMWWISDISEVSRALSANQQDSVAVLLRRVLDDNHACGHTTPDTLNAIESALQSQQGASADRGEAVCFRFQLQTGEWSRWLSMEDLTHYGPDGNLVDGPHPDWKRVEYAYAATPPSPAESADRGEAVYTLAMIEDAWGASVPLLGDYCERFKAALVEVAQVSDVPMIGNPLMVGLRDPIICDDASLEVALREIAAERESAAPSGVSDAPPVYFIGNDGRLGRYPAEQPDFLALLDRARIEYPGDGSAGTVLDWLDEQYANAMIGQPQPGRVEGVVPPLIMCGCHDEIQRRLCSMRDKCTRAYATAGGQEADQ